MINKKTILIISFLFLVVIPLTAYAGFMDGWRHGEWRDYAKKGWLKVDISDVNVEYTGYKRLLIEMAYDKGVKIFVESKGIPDYLYVPDRDVLYLAYIKSGMVYNFPNISAFGSSPIGAKYSQMVNNLPSNILEEFQRYDHTFSKQLDISKPSDDDIVSCP